MREKAKLDELTFALTANVTEAHRQVPVHPDDWHLLGCQVVSGGEVFVNTVGTLVLHRRRTTGLELLQTSVDCRTAWLLMFLRHVAHAGGS